MKLRKPLNKILNVNMKRYLAHKAFFDKYGLLFGQFTTRPSPKMKVYKSMRQVERDFKTSSEHTEAATKFFDAIIIDDIMTGESIFLKGD